jgi:hypothetical protein
VVPRIDFPNGIVIEDQSFALILFIMQPMFLTNSFVERHTSGGSNTFGHLRLNHYRLSRKARDGFHIVMLFRRLNSVRVSALSFVFVGQNFI